MGIKNYLNQYLPFKEEVLCLSSKEEVLDRLFEKTEDGYIVYKVFGMWYEPPEYWNIKKNSIIKEKVDMDRRKECSYGINVATLCWIKKLNLHNYTQVWKCLIRFEDLNRVCVPYRTDEKVRCGKLKLLEIAG